ncbi:DUF2089 family protein [candidate division GN15 bacterium]|nr:DUF2089 family protein [candidate division GN15 bacterium]
MAESWQTVTELIGDRQFIVERLRLTDSGVAIEGSFEPPPLAGLSADELVFLAAFVRSHGSIKQMEKLFGVSYPTIKNRLNRLGERLGFVDIDVETPDDRQEILGQLDRGEITVAEALGRLQGGDTKGDAS